MSWTKGDVVRPADMQALDIARIVNYDSDNFTLTTTTITTTGSYLTELEVVLNKPSKLRMLYNLSATFNSAVTMEFLWEYRRVDPTIPVVASTYVTRMRNASTTSIVNVRDFCMTPTLTAGLWRANLRVRTLSATGLLTLSNGSYAVAWGY